MILLVLPKFNASMKEHLWTTILLNSCLNALIRWNFCSNCKICKSVKQNLKLHLQKTAKCEKVIRKLMVWRNNFHIHVHFNTFGIIITVYIIIIKETEYFWLPTHEILQHTSCCLLIAMKLYSPFCHLNI